jgi:hypothetical protein
LKKLNFESISINFEKSNFCVDKVTYLGFDIDKNGIRTTPTGLDKLSNLKEIKPKNKRDLQRIVGLLNWFRPFV